MSTITKYPKTITQTNGSRDRKFANLSNLKKSSGYCVSESLIAGRTGTHNKPSILTLTGYGIVLPTGAEVTSIKVEYAHQKVNYQGASPNIPAPQISLIGDFTSSSKTGKAPTTSMMKNSVTFTNKTGVPSSKITSNKFGVKINYPTNANTNQGYLRVQYVRVIVTYKQPSYTFALTGGSGETGENVTIKATINNKTGTKYNPNVNITLPSTITYKSKTGDGTITNKGNGNLVWNPQITSKTKSRTIILNVQLGAAGTGNIIKITEPTTKSSKTLTLNISEAPSNNPDDETGEDSPLIPPSLIYDYTVRTNETFNIEIDPEEIYPERIKRTTFQLSSEGQPKYIQFKNSEGNWDSFILINEENLEPITAKSPVTGVFKIKIEAFYTDDAIQDPVFLKEFMVQVVPDLSNIGEPTAALMQLDPEELNRLGDGYVYTMQSYIRATSTEEYPHDWGKNWRIGVFNNPINETNILFEDKCTVENHNDIWGVSGATGNLERTSDGTVLTGNWGHFFIGNITNYIFNQPLTMEVDIISVTYPSKVRVQLYDGSNQTTKTFQELGINSASHLKVSWANSNVEYYVDDELILTQPVNLSFSRIGFQSNADTACVKIKNFIIRDPSKPTREPILIINEDNEYEESIFDNHDYNNLTAEEIIKGAEYWSTPLSIINNFQSLNVNFPYNEEYPLYFIFAADYKDNSIRSKLEYTVPVIVEDDEFKGFELTGNYPIPINSTIIPTDDIATLVVPEMQIATPIIAYSLPLNDLDENIIVKGIEISLDCEYADSSILSCKLRNHNGIIGERSVVISSTDENIVTIGDPTDKWGFKPSELSDFDKWEIELQVNNLFDNELNNSTFLFDNITMILHTTTVNSEIISCLIDGELLSAYNAFLLDVEIPAGLETNTKYIAIDGTDTNDAYRQNIKEKEIKIKFAIDGCTLEENTGYLQEITKLFMNERNNLNNPIEKRIEFSHFPGIYWEYIMEKAISTDIDAGRYECEATLIVPSGTAFSNEEIVTGSTGRVNGLAKINPVIVAINPDNDVIKINEEFSGQSFVLTYNFLPKDEIEINCSNRKVILNREEDKIDITGYVDYSSDWFKISGDYIFEASGCVIQTISRTERR